MNPLDFYVPMSESSYWNTEGQTPDLTKAYQLGCRAHLIRLSKGMLNAPPTDVDNGIDPNTGYDLDVFTTGAMCAAVGLEPVYYHRIYHINRELPASQAARVAELYRGLDLHLMSGAPLILDIENPFGSGPGTVDYNRQWAEEFRAALQMLHPHLAAYANKYLWDGFWQLSWGDLDYGVAHYIDDPAGGWPIYEGAARTWDEIAFGQLPDGPNIPATMGNPAWWQISGTHPAAALGLTSEHAPVNILRADVFERWFGKPTGTGMFD